ncbi:hypothetical protein CYY_006228 [Polysphondylium violaceum]|uniref:Uncharacterized protein n=1 Tax=Polysphondylium violaceum TaxID=133409 RepID=A0A8J4V3C7_9MYCE|nr:hypothetical protein CYY_006228 [Polysphondylium violaceum]
MELNLTFTENRAIKILILPIGDISPEKYKEYSNLIKTINFIELSSITRNPNETSPLEKISWIDGNMLLNFVDSINHSRSEFEEFQVYKKVFGVIGVVDCKKSKDLLETKRLFEEAVSLYPSAVSTLCCAFDPMDDQPDLDLGANLIMIPNNSDRKHLIFYLTTLLIDFSHMIFKYFEKMVGESESNTPLISTPLESKGWDEFGKAKKRKLGRFYKCKGDYCLLAGSPLDAFKYYDQSIELTRSNNDWEWLAGSQEGYISAILLKRNQDFNSQNHSNSLSPNTNNYLTDTQINTDDQLIKEMANESIANYNKRKTVQFEIDISLKFANYHISMDRKIEASDLLTNTYDIAFDLNLDDKIMVSCSIALLYYSMNFKRKFAFYLREAAFLNHRKLNYDRINNLLIIASKYYQLEDLYAKSPAIFLDQATNKTVSFTLNQMKRSNSKSSKQQQVQQPTKANNRFNSRMPQLSSKKEKYGWSVIQRCLILNLITVSVGMLDSLSICKYIIYLLRTQYKQLAQQKQIEFQSDLLHHSKTLPLNINTNVQMNSLGLPFIGKVVPLSLPNHLVPNEIKSANSSTTKDKFFIYSPYEKDNLSNKKQKIVWTCDEECNVLVTLSNPFSFDIFIQSLTLSTAGVPFESYPLSFKILSFTDSMDIIISGRALKPGPLIIKGVFVRSYNLISEYPINQQGASINLNEYYSLVKKDAYKVESWEVPIVSEQDDSIINKIKVIPKLPMLNVVTPTVGGNILNLFAGEYYTFNMEFENIGTLDIDSIQITLDEFDKNLRKSIQSNKSNQSYIDYDDDEMISFSWDQSLINSHLPLLPGSSFSLPIIVFSKPFLIGNQFIIKYQSGLNQNQNQINNNTMTTTTLNTNTNQTLIEEQQPQYERKILIPIQLNVIHGPQIINFDILYASSKTLQSLGPYIIEKQQKTSGNPLGNSTMSLSCSSAIEANSLNNEMITSNSIHNDYCLLVFDIMNCTSTHTFTIASNLNFDQVSFEKILTDSKFMLSPNSTISIIVPMKRESFPDVLPPLRQPKGQYIKPKKKPTEHEEYLNRLVQYYKDLLIKNIELNWLSSDNTKGIILLNNIILTSKLVYKLNNDSILLEFRDNILSKEVPVGEFHNIDVCVTNVTNQLISGLVLHIQPILDKQISNKIDLSQKFGYVGSFTVPITELAANSTFNHTLPVVFFEKDSFRFIISCELFKTKHVIPSPHSLHIKVV